MENLGACKCRHSVRKQYSFQAHSRDILRAREGVWGYSPVYGARGEATVAENGFRAFQRA